MTDLKNEKLRVRKELRQQLRDLPTEQRDQWSRQITDRLLALPEYQHAQTIMAFFSFSTEYDTAPLIRHALSEKKAICAPRVDWSTWRMSPVLVSDPDQFTKDDRGLMEPTGDRIADLETIDLIIIPGLAFDLTGRRLGRGAGFYDRFLSQIQLRHAIRLAPIFDLQLIPTVPADQHDQLIDIILTPTKLHRLLRHR
ncbi:MAG: 5-formyltetrahydrofolate cyclo-ligase [Phycisphaerae bacterium]|jgi:5-formyltetrahydrofolate cyclo-ligase|nr:5-formyltetrahydrofolate cyclo-ligase [Phycisphaerae bacterium]